MEVDKKTTRQIMFSMAAYSSVCIFGPLIFFGSIGWFLDRRFDSSPKILLFTVLIAFIFTNIFLYKKVKYFTKKFNEVHKISNNKDGENKS